MKKTRDLTQGNILSQLLLFALPLFGSSLIQQLYNTVDLIFVGQLLGKEVSAAVGSSSLMVTCLLGLFTGLGVGASVVTAKAFGARKPDELGRVIHTTAALSMAGSMVLLIVGWLVAPIFLSWMNTPTEIFDLAVGYIRIYFLSLPFMVCYNMGAGILRALGDSRTPMLYQLAGGVINVIGNSVFLGIMGWGVSGVAMSTFCSQGIAALLTIRHLCRMDASYRLQTPHICFHWNIVQRILAIGVPAAIQAMVITLSNLIVQAQINSLGVVSMAAFTAYFKVENFIYLPILAIGQAASIFVGQNTGAGNSQRSRQGIRYAILFGVGLTVAISAVLLHQAPVFFRLFANEQTVIELGVAIATVTFPFYFLYVFLEVLASSLRGAGKSIPPMVIILVNLCGLRIGFLLLAMHLYHSATGVAIIYPLTWGMTSLCLYVYYKLRFEY